MIARLIESWRDRHAHKASTYLTARRIRKEREAVHSVARRLRQEAGLPPHPALN